MIWEIVMWQQWLLWFHLHLKTHFLRRQFPYKHRTE